MGRYLMIAGAVMVIIGFLFHYTGLGRLPGDVVVKRKNFTFYFPLMTSIVLSLLFSLVLWFFRRGR